MSNQNVLTNTIIVGFISLIAILMLTTAVVFERGNDNTDTTVTAVINQNANSNVNADVTTVDTSDWLTYENEEYGFSLEYPQDWNDNPISSHYQPSANTDFLFNVDKIYPNSVGGSDFGEISFLIYPINSYTSLEEWITKERLIDEEVATQHSQKSVRIGNHDSIYREVTSGVSGGFFNSYFIELPNAVLEIEVNSRILTADSHNQEDFDRTVEQILATLEFIFDTSDWLTYENEEYGYSFMYRPDLLVQDYSEYNNNVLNLNILDDKIVPFPYGNIPLYIRIADNTTEEVKAAVEKKEEKLEAWQTVEVSSISGEMARVNYGNEEDKSYHHYYVLEYGSNTMLIQTTSPDFILPTLKFTSPALTTSTILDTTDSPTYKLNDSFTISEIETTFTVKNINTTDKTVDLEILYSQGTDEHWQGNDPGATGYYPNPSTYSQDLGSDLLEYATILYRAHYLCDGTVFTEAQPVGAYEKINLASGYGNVICRNRKVEQCERDGTFDHYYDERCDYGIVTFAEGSTKSAPNFSITVSAISDQGVEIEVTEI